jgi:DNA invertase Pin-like site-specific DNA recombinase
LTDRPLSLVAYARISDLSGKRGTPRQDHGIKDQLTACEDIARNAGGIVVNSYADNDLSASRDDHRPGFEALLADLHRGSTAAGHPIQGVVAVDTDRLFKTPAQWARFSTAFSAAPGRVFADEHGIHDLGDEQDAESWGEFHVAVAAGENQKRRARTRRWHASQARRGVAHTGGRPFGYRKAEGPGGLEIVPEEAAVIRAAVAACVAGEPWGGITTIFQESGIPTRKGGPWRGQTVKQIISSPRLAGLRVLGGELVTCEDGQPVVGLWEPIISQAEWRAVVARYRPRDRLPGGYARNPKPTPERKYLLAGLLHCGNVVDGRPCGTVMSGCATKIGVSRYRYACRSRAEGGCGGSAVSGEWIEGELVDLVMAYLGSRAAVGLPRPARSRGGELSALLARRDVLEGRWAQGNVSDEFFFRNSATLEGLVTDLRDEQARWMAAVTICSHSAEELRRRWSLPIERGGYDLDQKRMVIFDVLASVLVYPVGKGTKKRGWDSYEPEFRAGRAAAICFSGTPMAC